MIKPIKRLAESLVATAGDYLSNRIDLLKLKIANKASNVLSAIISAIVLIIFFFIFFIIFNIGIALMIGHFIGHSYLGFLIVSGFYLLIGVIIFMGRNAIIKSVVSSFIIKKMFKNADQKN